MSAVSLNIPLYVYNKIFAFRAIWPLTNSHENKAVQIMLKKNQTISIKFISAKFLIYACSHLALSFGTVTFLSSHSPSILSTYPFSCTWKLSLTPFFLFLPMFFFLLSFLLVQGRSERKQLPSEARSSTFLHNVLSHFCPNPKSSQSAEVVSIEFKCP